MEKNEINFKEIIDSLIIEDESYKLKKRLINQGYGLDILVNDENDIVRRTVADQGYGLYKLIHDQDQEVRKTAIEQLNKVNN